MRNYTYTCRKLSCGGCIAQERFSCKDVSSFIVATLCRRRSHANGKFLIYARFSRKSVEDQRQISPQQIFLYGESLGGAVAVDLAVKHPTAAGLIVQSSFTSMAAVVKRTGYFRAFPVDWLLRQKFDSLSKVRSLHVPVLFIHGTADSRVPWDMSQQLFTAAPEPKQLLLIPGAGHSRIYRAENSYLKSIQRFIEQVHSRQASYLPSI